MSGCPYTNCVSPRSLVDTHAQQLDAHNANVDIQSCVMVAHLYAMGGQLSRMGFHVCEWKSTRLCGRPKSGHTYIWISTSSVGCPRSSRRSGGNPRECPRDCLDIHEQPHDIGWKATHSCGRPPENLRELRVYGATWTPISRCVAGHVGLYVYGQASVAHCVMGTHSLMRSPARSNGFFCVCGRIVWGVDASVTRNVSVRIQVARYVMGSQAILCEWPREFMGAYICPHNMCTPTLQGKKIPLSRRERGVKRGFLG